MAAHERLIYECIRKQVVGMRLGVDAGPMIGRGGISRYVGPLLRTLITDSKDFNIHLVLRRGWSSLSTSHELEHLAPVTRLSLPDRAMTWWWNTTNRSAPFSKGMWESFDLYLSTCLMSPVLSRGKVISIVYDLIPLRLPELFPNHRCFHEQIRRVCDRSTLLVAISECTKRDLVDLMNVPPERIHVVYPGRSSNSIALTPESIKATMRRYQINQPYVLYVGSLGAHKNITTLLHAYEQARLSGAITAKLVLVGGTEWGSETLRVLNMLRVKHDVLVTGFIPDEELLPLYAGSELFVFPSLYEGFGLPVLDAMTVGKPVIVSKGGALPEAAGPAGLCFNPYDADELTQMMIQVLNDPLRRTEMGQASVVQAKKFSWEMSAAQLRRLLTQTGMQGQA